MEEITPEQAAQVAAASAAAAQPTQVVAANQLTGEGSEEFQIGVSEPEKVGEGMSQYSLYTITIKTSNPNFAKSEFSVSRRYSDFEWLRNELTLKFRNLLVPPMPEKAVINKFQKEFVTYRRKELERFLKRIVQYREFVDSAELRMFFDDSDPTMAKAKAPQNKPAKGFFAFVTEKVTQVQAAVGKAEEVDAWFDNQKTYLTTLDAQLNTLLTKGSRITNVERDSSQIWLEFGQATNLLAATEEDSDKTLAAYYTKLTDVANQISALEKELSENEAEFFEDSLKDYIRLIGAAKDLLGNRSHDLWLYQSATKNREAKQEKVEKLRGTPKEAAAVEEVRDAETKEREAKNSFDQISQSSRQQLSQFGKNKNLELSSAIRRLVQTNMNHSLRVVDLWKEVLQVIEDADEAALKAASQ